MPTDLHICLKIICACAQLISPCNNYDEDVFEMS